MLKLPKLRCHLPLLLALATAATSLCAQDAALGTASSEVKPVLPPSDSKAVPTAQIVLNDGDTVVFLGDSITHQCLYTQYVEDFFYTRFAGKRLHFHNAGIGGDRAQDAVNRFDEDVAAFKPKLVTVLLGMNDGSYTRYEQPIFDTYQRGMNTVLDRIAAIGALAVPMTPTMHDARAARVGGKGSEPRDTYYNGVLALYGAWLREQAQVRGLGFAERKKDPAFTMIRDAVHPDAPGQAVMAVALLEDVLQAPIVSRVSSVVQDGKRTATAENGELSDVAGTEESVSFTLKARALPWVLPEPARKGYELTDAATRLNIERLVVGQLASGTYQLAIEGQVIGSFSDLELAGGVDLAGNDKTPQHQQAGKVAELNKKRNDEAIRPLRDQWGQLKGRSRDVEKARETNSPQLAEKEAALATFRAEMKLRVDELIAKGREFEKQIYEVAQPVARKYEIKRVP
jgi:lysophospholipase L1-like esterase